MILQRLCQMIGLVAVSLSPLRRVVCQPPQQKKETVSLVYVAMNNIEFKIIAK